MGEQKPWLEIIVLIRKTKRTELVTGTNVIRWSRIRLKSKKLKRQKNILRSFKVLGEVKII